MMAADDYNIPDVERPLERFKVKKEKKKTKNYTEEIRSVYVYIILKYQLRASTHTSCNVLSKSNL